MGLGHELHDIFMQVVLGCAFVLIVCLSWCACQTWCVEVDLILQSCRKNSSTNSGSTQQSNLEIPQVIITVPSPSIQHLLPGQSNRKSNKPPPYEDFEPPKYDDIA